jgi:hypothetical protein
MAIQIHLRNPEAELPALLIPDMLVLFQKASHAFHSKLKGLGALVVLLLKVRRHIVPSPIFFVGTRLRLK